MASKTMKTRCFSTLVYPESAPENWFSILEELKVPAIVSPLHKDDVNPGGSPKKPHYHVNIYFDGPRSKEYAESLFAKIGGVGCETINSVRGATRYLLHMDNPEKAQYKREDIKELCGADFDAMTALPSDEIKGVREMMDFISNNCITSFNKFADYCAQNNNEWFKLLISSKSYFIKEYIKSLAWDLREQYEKEDE
jgi:hypothetical protein